MRPDENTIREFLRRVDHPVALIGRKPIDSAPKSMVLWPREQDDPPDQACWLSDQYHAVYCNLNPLDPFYLTAIAEPGRSVADSMIAARTRVLIDVDGHKVPKELARQQKDEIKAELGEPLMETDSGNGYGLIYPCNLPNDEPTKFKAQAFLAKLKPVGHVSIRASLGPDASRELSAR